MPLEGPILIIILILKNNVQEMNFWLFLTSKNHNFVSILDKMASKASKRAVEEDLANVEFETSEDVEVYLLNTWNHLQNMFCMV